MKKLLFILPLLLIPILATKPVSAVGEDITYTVDSTSTFPYYFCDNSLTNSQVKCSDYSNIILTATPISSQSYFTIGVNSTTIRLPNFTETIFDLSTVDSIFFATFNNQSITSASVILTNSLDCPEPEPCDCPIDCDEPFIVQLFKSGFWGVATALVTIIVPILALFLVFRLIHDFLWGRG